MVVFLPPHLCEAPHTLGNPEEKASGFPRSHLRSPAMKLSLDEARTLIEVGEDATPEEIKTKYKRLALKWCEGITCRASKCMIPTA